MNIRYVLYDLNAECFFLYNLDNLSIIKTTDSIDVDFFTGSDYDYVFLYSVGFKELNMSDINSLGNTERLYYKNLVDYITKGYYQSIKEDMYDFKYYCYYTKTIWVPVDHHANNYYYYDWINAEIPFWWEQFLENPELL